MTVEARPCSVDTNSHTTPNVATTTTTSNISNITTISTSNISRDHTGLEGKADQTNRERTNTIQGTAPPTPPVGGRRRTFSRWDPARKTSGGTTRIRSVTARPGEREPGMSTNQTRVGPGGKTREARGPRRKTAIFDLA